MKVLEATSPDLPGAEHPGHSQVALGIVVYDDHLDGDAFLAQCADALTASGYRLGGLVQSNVQRRGRRKCDMYVRDLLTGDEIRISLDRGNEARGCRLDPAAFTRIGAWVERALAEEVDLLVLNKFGKEEAQGRGLRPLIAEALMAEIPVVIGVSRRNLADLSAFAGDAATALAPDPAAITAWCRNAIECGTVSKFRRRSPCAPA